MTRILMYVWDVNDFANVPSPAYDARIREQGFRDTALWQN